jgi:hypothetical protein
MQSLRLLLPIIVFSLADLEVKASIRDPGPYHANTPLKEIIRHSPRTFASSSGIRLNLKQRVAFRLLKPAMKKALKENPEITVGEFFAKRSGEPKTGGSILVVILLLVLFGFLVFVINFQD